jgi:N-acyl-D-aspartate/D-glutamate deacylase
VRWSFALILVLVSANVDAADRFDVVIRGGRVMDPETGRDGVFDVGLVGDRIARISAQPLEGTRVIDARGLVVAPGFIDLHQHSFSPENDQRKALDGVTTALEMEIGRSDVAAFLAERRGHALIHFGATASHPAARHLAWGGSLGAAATVPPSGPSTNESASPEQRARTRERLEREIAAGGLGIGMGLQYTPGATRQEVIETFRVAAAHRLPVFTHIRSAGRIEPGSSIESVGEVIAAAATTGASLQIVHINSSGLRDAPECLALIAGARARGLDVTTEAYPYEAGMTLINSAFFNPGWREKLGIDYKDLQVPETGERLTKARFDELHADPTPRWITIFANPVDVMDVVIRHPLVMIASDGIAEHPRNAGTFCRILARYVREQHTLTLMDALRKMSLMPAQRLETATPSARSKGRLQEGADADVVVFDPETVADRATYAKATETSVGVKYLLVAGTLVVDAGRIVSGVAPGRALMSGR